MTTDRVEDGTDLTADDESGVALINMVDDNCSNYTNCAYLCAELARKIQHMICHPSAKEYSQIIERNLTKFPHHS